MAFVAPALAIAPPEHLPKKGNLSDNWRKWKQNFIIYLGAAGISSTDITACPLFLHNIGQYGRDIFNELGIEEPYNLEEFYAKFDEHCNPKRNLTFERYTFFNIKQQNNQSFDKFYSLLKQRSLNCEFGDLTNSLIATQLIIGINNVALRKSLLAMPDLTLNDIIEQCKATEIATAQAKKIEDASIQTKTCPKRTRTAEAVLVEKLSQLNTNPVEKMPERPNIIQNCKFCSNSHLYGKCPSKSRDTETFNCKSCGQFHTKGKCPAYGAICNKCKKPNHFVKMCNKA